MPHALAIFIEFIQTTDAKDTVVRNDRSECDLQSPAQDCEYD